jgi:hypothetical protein
LGTANSADVSRDFFAYGYVLTGSLWRAVGLHVFGNVILHEVLGMGGKSGIATMVFHEPWPSSYDPAFLVWLGVGIPAAVIGALLVRRFRRIPGQSV